MVRLLIQLGLLGVFAWAIGYFLPMPEKIKTLIYVVAVIVALLMTLAAFGVDTGVKVPR